MSNTEVPPYSGDAKLSPEDEARFRADYEGIAGKQGLDPDPDNPEHHYFYRRAWQAGKMTPDESGHFSSEFKEEHHPNRYIGGEDTITGRQINPRNQEDTDEIDKLREEGHTEEANRLLDKQRDQLAVGHAVALALGQDPDKWRPPQATGLHSEIELEAWCHRRARLMAGEKRIYDEEGLSKVTELRRLMVQTYKQRHDASVTGDPAESMPLEWDPNELADARARIAKIHNRIRKEVDPNFNAYTDPFLGPLSQSMTEGNLAVSGAQPMHGDFGALGEAAELAFAPIRGALDAGFEFGYGLASLGNRVIQGLSGGQLGLHVQEPTHGVTDEDGKLWTNAGKVSGFGHMAAMAQAMVYGQVTEDVAQLGETIAFKDAQRHGLERFAHGTAYGIGAFGAMGVGAAPFAALARKGLTWLGSGGLGLYVARSQKILDVASSALGMGAYEAIAKGESDGYGKAGVHGMILGALAGGLGLLGRRTEAFLTQQKVPAVFARAVAGATEGFGFSVPTQEMWDFIKDPSKETWSRYASMAAVNIAAMGMLKTFGQTPSEHLLAPEQMPRTKLPAAPEQQARASEELVHAETRARESYSVEGREGRVLPVIEHKGGVAEGQGRQTEASAGASVAKALEEGLPSRYRDERELSHGEAMQQKMEERRKGQRGRDPLEDPEFQSLPEDIKSAMLATKDVGERMRLWNESAERVLRPEIEALQQKIAAEGRGPALDDMRRLSLRAMGTPLEGEVRTITHGAPIVKEKKGFQVPAEASREAKFYKEQLEARDKKAREAERLAEFGRKLRSAEQAKQRPELRTMAFEAQQEARQEIAGEVRGPQSPERLQEEREDTYASIRSGELEGPRPPSSQTMTFHGTGEAKEGATPTRASDIFLAMQGVHKQHPIKFLIQWKRAGHWVKGFYRSLERRMRQNIPLELNTGAHEFAHAMQDQTIGLRWKPKNKQLRQEMQQLGKDLYGEAAFKNLPVYRQVAEGWAEFWARDLLGDPDLDASFPRAARFLRAWMAAPEQAAVRDQYLHVKRMMQDFRDQGWEKQGEMRIHMADAPMSPEVRAAMGSKWKRFKAWIDIQTDDSARARHVLQKYGIEHGDVPITADPHRMMDTLRMRARGIAETFLQRATLGRAFGRTGEGLKQALSPITFEERVPFANFLVSLAELARQDRRIEMTERIEKEHGPTEMSERLRAFQGSLPREGNLAIVAKLDNPRFREAADRVKGVFDRATDFLAVHGAISEVSAQLIKDSYAYYVPLFRVLDGPRRAGQPPRGVAEGGPGVGHAEGSTREIEDPYESMQKQIYNMVNKALQASAMKSMRLLTLIEPKTAGIMNRVPQDVRPIVLDVKGLRRALEKLGISSKAEIPEADIASILTLFEPIKRPTGHEAIVEFSPNWTERDLEWMANNYGPHVALEAVKESGKAGWWELDKDMFESVMGLDAENAMYAPPVVSWATRLVKLGRVALSPAFALNNILRDAAELPMFGSSELQTRWVPIVGGLTEWAIGARAQLKGRNPWATIQRKAGKNVPVDPVAQILLDAGLKGATYLSEASQPTVKYHGMLRQSLKERVVSSIEHPLKTALRSIEYIERGLSEAELPGRVREGKLVYERAIKNGKSEEEAAFESLEASAEVTQNFIRNGAFIRGASRYYAFLGARIGGVRRITRAMLGYDGVQKRNRVIIGGVSTLSTLAVLNYLLNGKEEKWQSRPDWLKNNYITWFLGGLEITWPKSHEASKIFYNPVEYGINAIFGKERDSLWEWMGGMLVNELSDYAMLPTIFQTPAELYSNKNFFTGKPLVPQWMEEALPPEKRYHVYTTWIAKQIGKVIGVSPIKVEHAMSQTTGGLALSMMRTIDEMADLKEEAQKGIHETDQERLAELPFIGTLFRMHPFEQSYDVNRFYELHKELNQTKEPRDEQLRLESGRLKKEIGEIYKSQREGRLTREQADERAYKIAHPFVERYERTRR